MHLLVWALGLFLLATLAPAQGQAQEWLKSPETLELSGLGPSELSEVGAKLVTHLEGAERIQPERVESLARRITEAMTVEPTKGPQSQVAGWVFALPTTLAWHPEAGQLRLKELAVRLLEDYQGAAAGTEYEAWFFVTRSIIYSNDGRSKEAGDCLGHAAQLMDDSTSFSLKSYWLDTMCSHAFRIGSLEAAWHHAVELGDLVEAQKSNLGANYGQYAFMAVDQRLRACLALRQFDCVRSTWKSIQQEPWFRSLSTSSQAALEYQFWWAETDVERGGSSTSDEAAVQLERILREEEVGADVRWSAGFSLALLLAHRGEEVRLQSVVEQMPALDRGDQGLARLGLEMYIARRSGDVASLAPMEERASKRFTKLIENWRQESQGREQGGILQIALRSAFVHERLQAKIALEAGDGGARAALEELLDLHLSVRGEPSDSMALSDFESRVTGPERAALVFLPSRLGTLLFALEHERLTVHELQPFDQLTRSAIRLEQAAGTALEHPSAAANSDLAGAIEEASRAFLPASLAGTLARNRDLVVVGAEDLGWPLLELCRGPDSDEPKASLHLDGLGSSHAIWYHALMQDSVRLAGSWPEAVNNSAGASILVAPLDSPGRAENRRALSALDRSFLDQAAEALGGGSDVSVGSDACLPRLSKAEGQRLWGITAHGLHEPSRLDPSGLLLPRTEGGEALPVWSADIAQLEAPPIVMLFACRAGLSTASRGGGGGRHLAPAFQRAGARAVALATTPLEYHASLELQALLAVHLAAGLPLAEALRRCRASPISSALKLNAMLIRIHGWGGGALPVVALPRGPSRLRRWLAAIAVIAALAATTVAMQRQRKPRRTVDF